MAQSNSDLPCTECGFTHQCICALIPKLSCDLDIVLLMHPNECGRATNTGKLLQKSLPNCSSFTWDRRDAPEGFLAHISRKNVEPFIIFPSEESLSIQKVTENQSKKKHVYIILDGTWQEARKMVRKSSWLSDIPMVSLSSIGSSSDYTLRRNQEQGNLCTLEVGCELLKAQGERQQASNLREFFSHYLRVFQADRSGHQLKQ
ncbi:tRNA-uridine aminocarboxypropyltransferase [Vibrio marisflavi]|uniref:tRNA-uridine aminocarboxypropyltransferase n=1 Tax=Vibrio marisflavi CECT 7928 TaxID=634439 RepID=A0ABM9A8V2_9VIBR|nr:DTW domain-containing protein [Vibrio marisflavi]CAH0542643.1 hypothetical protein VMF7928_04134 [Vibrio marisflavi CECT 7928]